MALVASLPQKTEISGPSNNEVPKDPPAPVPTPEVSKEDFNGLKDQVSQIKKQLMKKFAHESSDGEIGSSSGEDSPW